ncbi:ATP-binding cassette domain-containing protein [Streptomyces sp. NPDC020875]|uniref:ATP-binding cassette domain-containing protein n=1 Tax=Streptomyces sp. NPDC020875 TaxID=3154898 RepID=UPI0033E7787E
MLQAIGLTSTPGKKSSPAVDDLTFDAAPGAITALLGPDGAGKTTALRLMLELEPGQGVTYYRGNRLGDIAHPAREVGALLGDVPGHPARTARGQLRMLCAAAGVPLARAGELLEAVGLAGMADERLGSLPLAMDRRLGLASALLGDPGTLLLDEPAKGLSPRDQGWLYGMLRSHADRGGTVVCAVADPKEAARIADHVVTLDAGRLVADQDGAEFARTRLRPRVSVRTPHAVRLADVVHREARAARRSVEVVPEPGGVLSVYGSSCAEVGEAAFRHGVLVHRLTDETGDTAPASTGPSAPVGTEVPAEPARPSRARRWAAAAISGAPPAPRPVTSPVRPLRYELHRMFGVRTVFRIAGATVLVSVVAGLLMARSGGTSVEAAVAARPGYLPLPPVAFAAGLVGALSFGDEYRYPALAAARGTVPRRLGLLIAKLTVTAVCALGLIALVAAAGFWALRLVYGAEATVPPGHWPALAAGWGGLAVGSAWAGLLAAGIFRSTAAGAAAVLAVPVVVTPLMRQALIVPAARSVAGLPDRLRELAWVRLPHQADIWLLSAARLLARPAGAALALSLAALVCAYAAVRLRRRTAW